MISPTTAAASIIGHCSARRTINPNGPVNSSSAGMAMISTKSSVRNVPAARDAPRAQKSATPHSSAAERPRKTPVCIEGSTPGVERVRQRREEPVDVRWRVVEMRRDADRVATYTDVDVRLRQSRGQVGGELLRAQADQLAGVSFRWRNAQAEDGSAAGNLGRHRAQRRGDLLHAPLKKLLQCGLRHRQQREVAALAHVIAPRAGLELVAVVHQPREILAV